MIADIHDPRPFASSVPDGQATLTRGRPAQTIGVLGAGTMGSGIGQLAVQSGAQTLLFDPDAAALQSGLASVADGVRKLVAKGRLDGNADEIIGRARGVSELSDLADCDLIIEAAPEILELKHKLLGQLSSDVVRPDCVLASNTSSLPITAVAAAVAGRERVVGMHFFNPAPLMALVEVVAGIESGAEAMAVARATGEAMGRRVIEATDGPGFVVNRCNRPFGLEALRLVHERVVGLEEVDRLVRLGGFRMGPFELQDLVGIDTSFAVAKSFFALGFAEPRWRPSPLSEQKVNARHLGRKTGRGWYDYTGDGPYRPSDPDAPAIGGGDGGVSIIGAWPVAVALRERAQLAGWDTSGTNGGHALVIDCDGTGAGPRAVLRTSDELPAGTVGFHVLAPLGAVELMRDERTPVDLAKQAEEFFTTLGLHTMWIGDSPGGVLGRIVFQTINESCFALAEGVGSEQDIDDGMILGVSHPRGPFAWLRLVGPDHVVTVLEALRERHGDGYRVAPALRRLSRGVSLYG